MSVKITYNNKTTEIQNNKIATLPCKNEKMKSDVIITTDTTDIEDTSSINGIIEEYKVNAGANINAGDFIEFVTKFDSFSLETTASPGQMNVCRINEEQILAVYFIGTSSALNTSEIRATVITFKDGQVTVGTESTLVKGQDQNLGCLCVKAINENKFIMTYYALTDDLPYGAIITVTDTISIGYSYTLYKPNGLDGYRAIDMTVLTSTTVLLAASIITGSASSSQHCYFILTLLTINDNSITVTKTSTLTTDNYYERYLSLITLGENKALFSYSLTKGGVKTRTVDISGTQILAGTSCTLEADVSGYDVSSAKINENQAIISYYANSTRYAALVNIVDDIVTLVSKVSIGDDSSNSHIIPLSTTKFLLVYNYYAQILKITDTTIISSGEQRLKGSYNVRCLALSASSVIGVSERSGLIQCVEIVDDTMNQVTGIQGVETYVQPVTSSLHIGGIAKTSGVSGEMVEVYRPIEKIKFQIDYDDGMFYDFEAEKGMTWGEFVDSKYNNYGDELSVYRSDLADDGNGNAAIGVSGELLYHGYDLIRLVYEDDIIESMTYKSEYYSVSTGGSN